MKFTEFGFGEKMLRALEALGFDEATEVQEKAIPVILDGKNLVVRSQTGSGKTFAFGLPLLHATSTDIIFPETLIVCPTRELTLQVCDEIKKISGYMEGVKVVPIYGGSNITRQVQALKRKPQIIVGTPGRILDHIQRKTLKLHYLKNVVLDEADEMLNMGFKEDIENILKGTPDNKRTLLFSATYPEKIKQIVDEYLPEHEKIEIGTENKSLKNIFQQYVLVNKKDKTKALVEVVQNLKDKHILIFCNTKAMTEKIATELTLVGVEAQALHGDLRQSQRKVVTNDFKFKKISVLVASDVAARGLDINDIDYVVNYDIPTNLEYFLHRMGRTARAGKNGNAVTIVTSKNQLSDLRVFERQTDSNITQLELDAFDYDAEQGQETNKKPRKSSRNSSNDFSRTRKREDSNSRPKRDFDKKEKSFGERKERTFEKKERNSFEKNSERKPYREEERSFEKRSYDKKGSERKTYSKREDGDFSKNTERKPYKERERTYADKKTSFGKSKFGEKSERSGKSFKGKERPFSGSGKDFKNKATRVKNNFEVSERVFDKVKRKKEMATGVKIDERDYKPSSKSNNVAKKDGFKKGFGSKSDKNFSRKSGFAGKGRSSNFSKRTTNK